MMRALRRMTLLLALSLALVGAAHADADVAAPEDDRAPLQCLDHAIVVAYLHHFQDRVMQVWIVPEDSLGDQAVVARLRIAEDGRLQSWKLISSTNQRISNSVELALRHAGSAGPVPERAACLIGLAIDMRFENPY